MSRAAPVNKLKDDEIIKLIKIGMVVCGVIFILSATLLFLNRDNIAAQYRVRGLLSEISNASGTYLKDISVNIDGKAKTFDCTLTARHACTTDTCDAIRKAIDKYLKENSEFFLNDGYIIQLYIQDKSNGPSFLSISNQNYYSRSKDLYNSLNCLSIYYSGFSNFGNISSYKNWTDIRTLDLSEINMDDISILSQFTQLEYISKDGGFTEQETQDIKRMLPNCQIVSS